MRNGNALDGYLRATKALLESHSGNDIFQSLEVECADRLCQASRILTYESLSCGIKAEYLELVSILKEHPMLNKMKTEFEKRVDDQLNREISSLDPMRPILLQVR